MLDAAAREAAATSWWRWQRGHLRGVSGGRMPGSGSEILTRSRRRGPAVSVAVTAGLLLSLVLWASVHKVEEGHLAVYYR